MWCSIASDPENLTAITTLAGMGILTSDAALVDAALSEILALPLERRHALDPAHDVPYLLTQHHLAQGDASGALSTTQTAAYAEPSQSTIRRQLATLTLQQGEAATAVAVLRGATSADDAPEDNDDLALRAVAEAVVEPKDEAAVRLAQKAVQRRPWARMTWRALAYARNRVAGA